MMFWQTLRQFTCFIDYQMPTLAWLSVFLLLFEFWIFFIITMQDIISYGDLFKRTNHSYQPDKICQIVMV